MKLVCPNIVVGGCLSSAIYAKKNNYSLICDPHFKPFRFDGGNALSEWSTIIYELSLNGLVINSESIENIRLKENECKVVQSRHEKIEIDFETCHVFNSNRIVCDNEILQQSADLYRVYDWINVRSCSPHDVDYIYSGDDLAKEIYFYKSDRIEGDHKTKDIVSISFLDKDQLFDFEYSDTMVKFKLQDHMTQHGILGSRSGYQKNGNIRRNSIKLELDNREVFLISEHKYKDSKSIKFLNSTKDKDIILSNYA